MKHQGQIPCIGTPNLPFCVLLHNKKTTNLPLLNESAFSQVIGFIEVNLCFSWLSLLSIASNLPKWKQSPILKVQNEAFQPICLILQFFNPWLQRIKLIIPDSLLIKVAALGAFNWLKSNQLNGKFQPISAFVGPCSSRHRLASSNAPPPTCSQFEMTCEARLYSWNVPRGP